MNDRRIVEAACARAGVSNSGLEHIRTGENTTYRLPGGLVARVTRAGRLEAARREIEIAGWLATTEVKAVRPFDVDQPVAVDDHAVTFWHELPQHRHGTPAEIAGALRRLHDLPVPPDVDLVTLAPFVRIEERLAAARLLAEDDRAWLLARHAALQERYGRLSTTRPHCVVHGDAWAGNVVVTVDGEVTFLDLERCSIGPPEWDLVSTAIKLTSLAAISRAQYDEFCNRYGADVTDWSGYQMLRDIRELRMCTYVAQLASHNAAALHEAHHRIACIRGRKGPRPWTWTPF